MTDSEDSYNESAIIQRVLKGERDEFRHLIDRHKNMVFAMLMRQVGNHSVAEDLAQETFCRAYQHLKKFRFESSFSTWLTRIALNQAGTYFSSRKFKESKRTESFDVQTHDMGSSDIQHSQERKEIFAALRSALGELSPKLREVLVLCAFEGKSYEEAAEVLTVPVGTVRSRLNAARLEVKKLIPRSIFEA
ncbi:MAG: sigma-70 family RNA polymerase sigma factor [Deltaproteobacteria bacterium]|nr:sigma-70 family RNA polymerase sigma factor [Deltaproteobacteria bacterium]